MAIGSYRNFDIRVRREGPRSRCYYVEAEDGLYCGRFRHPYSRDGLDNIALKARARTSRTRLAGNDVRYDEAEAIGTKLFDCLFNGPVLEAWNRRRDEAEKEECGLRLRLHCDAAPELLDLPWEYLWDRRAENHVAVSENTPVVRCLAVPNAVAPLEVAHPLRVLVVVSSPRGLERLNARREWQKLEEIWSGSAEAGAVVLRLLARPTFQSVLDEVERANIQNEPYHIFHFIGHGRFNEAADEGELLFEDRRQPAPVGARRIAGLLRDYSHFRLAVFNACEAGRASRSDPFSGVTQRVVQQSLPASIGMQFEIPDRAAVTFSRSFYKSLAAGRPVEAALAMARKQMSADDGMEWAIPVLYVRPKTDEIFRFKGPPPPTPPAYLPSQPAPPPPAPQPSTAATAVVPQLDLYPPRGAIDPASRFYVKRREEEALVRQIGMKGLSFAISAPGLTGKSSLLRRLESEASALGKITAMVDLAAIASECFTEAGTFFRHFILEIADKLPVHVQRTVIEQTWADSGTNNIGRCSAWVKRFLEEDPLRHITLLLDGVDTLLNVAYRRDFAALLTMWHNSRRPSGGSPWNRLDMIVATSEEPLRWGLGVFFPITLSTFTEVETAWLNSKHGDILTAAQVTALWTLVAGHPYLIRQCLYSVAAGLSSAGELLCHECEPLVSHLTDLEARIGEAVLAPALKEILQTHRCTEDRSFYLLRSLGLIRRERRPVGFTCPLYETYFREAYDA